MSSESGPRVLAIVVVNQRREIARLIQLFEQRGQEWGLPEDDVVNVSLMLDEFVSNVIKYGYDDALEHEIHVDVELAGDLLTIRIEDDGKAFNPIDAPAPDLDLPIEQRPIGGLGIFIAKAMADSLDYRRERGRNVLTVTKRVRTTK